MSETEGRDLLEWHDKDRDIEVEVLDDGVYVYFYDKRTGREWTKPVGDLIAHIEELTERTEKAEALLDEIEAKVKELRPSDDAIEHRNLYSAADVDDLLDDIAAILSKRENQKREGRPRLRLLEDGPIAYMDKDTDPNDEGGTE